jgi:hypothetical protein
VQERIELMQDVVVLDVGVDLHQSVVLVDLYGGASNACGTVRLQLPDDERRAEAVRVLDRWRLHETPITLISSGTTVALQNDRAHFGPALEPPELTI